MGGPVNLSQDTFEPGIERGYGCGRDTNQRPCRLYQILNETRSAAQLLFADMLAQGPGNF